LTKYFFLVELLAHLREKHVGLMLLKSLFLKPKQIIGIIILHRLVLSIIQGFSGVKLALQPLQVVALELLLGEQHLDLLLSESH
jgi:hypothetical protein